MIKRAPINQKKDIYEKYRQILKIPNLSDRKIDEMRKNLRLICQSICEHIWGEKLY